MQFNLVNNKEQVLFLWALLFSTELHFSIAVRLSVVVGLSVVLALCCSPKCRQSYYTLIWGVCIQFLRWSL